jgi:hypothetical protein
VTADGARAVEAAVENDAYHGIPSVWRQLFRATDEVAGRIVHEDIDPAEVARHPHHHLVHLLGIPDVQLHCERIQTGVT